MPIHPVGRQTLFKRHLTPYSWMMSSKYEDDMDRSELYHILAEKQMRADEICEQVKSHPILIPALLEGLSNSSANIKFGSAKVLHLLSEELPDLLYPEMDFFASLLDNNNNIIKWNAIIIIGNLTAVDVQQKFERLFSRYYQPITGPTLITAANIIKSSKKIIRSKPQLADRIINQILKVEQGAYQTEDCRNIAIGHAIKLLEHCDDQISDRKAVYEFVERQARNPRPATRKAAESFLKKRKKSDSR
ncbi:MAG: hypothetical protein Kow0042_00560 [Calditrichia bacterium]